jgi:hypothetical protein
VGSKRFLLISILFAGLATAGCGNSIPQVDFFNSVNIEKKIPAANGTSNLTPTQELTGTGLKLKSRVSYVGAQQVISNGNVQIHGKISY